MPTSPLKKPRTPSLTRDWPRPELDPDDIPRTAEAKTTPAQVRLSLERGLAEVRAGKYEDFETVQAEILAKLRSRQ